MILDADIQMNSVFSVPSFSYLFKVEDMELEANPKFLSKLISYLSMNKSVIYCIYGI